tara:strand:- start:560 stop:682 length:123 start_codon:yes stop_codon:yes gene_type:complete
LVAAVVEVVLKTHLISLVAAVVVEHLELQPVLRCHLEQLE